jgi:hypothetical protein
MNLKNSQWGFFLATIGGRFASESHMTNKLVVDK